jgi:SPP1 family predicted phage head-tail adaptor
MLSAGMLRRRVTIQQRASTQDSFGQQAITWADVQTVYAHIESLSGNQLTQAQSIYSQTTHKVTVRYQAFLADVKTVGSYRILYGTRIFDIGADLNVDERNRVIELLCSEGLNDGQ